MGCKAFQLTAARRRLATTGLYWKGVPIVSTHSRPKAAGFAGGGARLGRRGFNSQPPEGGWAIAICIPIPEPVSTHSRPKAAGNRAQMQVIQIEVSTHSRPKAAGKGIPMSNPVAVRFNSQPPEGGWEWCMV